MKTILINIHDSYFVRSFLRTDTFDEFKKRRDIRLVFLVPQHKIEYYKKEFSHERVEFDIMPEIADVWYERLYKFIETASIHTKTVRMIYTAEFARSNLFFPIKLYYFLARQFLWCLGKWPLWRRVVRYTYLLIPSSFFSDSFDKYKPDLVYCPSLLYEDYCFVKEAKKRKIPVVGNILSWDNFYSKCILRVYPDYLFVHTSTIADQAVQFGDYPKDKIIITGLPQYDRYFTRKGLLPREHFMKSIGADPNKKLIVYGFSGKLGLHIDFSVVDLLAKGRQEGRLIQPTELLVRPYPRYDFSNQRLEELNKKYGILGVSSMAHVGNSKDNWEFDEHSLNLLTNTLTHADVIVTMYSTFFVEGAIFNKPLIGIGFDGEKKLPYWQSAERFFDWDHLKDIDKLNGITRVMSEFELIKAINDALEDPGYLSEGRQRIIKRQSEFLDGKSGKRVADALVRILNI